MRQSMVIVPDDWLEKAPIRANGYRALEIVLGGVLLLAAALKAYQFWLNREMVLPGVYQHPLFKALLVEAEVLLGFWLISGAMPRFRFITAIASFFTFAVFASHESLYGFQSCGCFGNLRVPPTITAAFDILAVGSLFLFRPNINVLMVRIPSRNKLRTARCPTPSKPEQ